MNVHLSILVGIELNNDLTVKNIRDLRKCTGIIQDFVLVRLNETIANKLLDSINVLHDNYVGTLKRCVFSLETNGDDASELSASKALQEVSLLFFNQTKDSRNLDSSCSVSREYCSIG